MSRPRKILIADDSIIIRETLRVMLEPEGYLVIFAEDGQKAVELAESQKPDLVIADGLMPRLHGFLACKAIKELEDAPKVILLTGVYTKPSYKWEVKKNYGADDLLCKPVNRAELIACVERQLAGLPPREDKIAFADLTEAIELNPPMPPLGLVFPESPAPIVSSNR
jgi:DNA-binding response OmpR family regulator